MDFPDDSIQYLVDNWWQKVQPGKSPQRGDLIRVMVPFRHAMPTRLVATRKENRPGDHDRVDYRMEQFSIDSNHPHEKLPIAGLVNNGGGSYVLAQYKTRPALVIASPAEVIDPKLTSGLAGYQKSNCFLVAPYYGTDKNSGRGGYPENLVQLVRRCRYRQIFWDSLPLPGDTTSSFLRLDSMFSVVDDRNHYKHTGYRMSNEGMEIFQEYLEWFLYGELPSDSLIRDIRVGLEELEEMR